MSLFPRRAFLARVCLPLPIVGKSRLMAFVKRFASAEDELLQGRNLVRLYNTAQSWYRLKNGHYADLQQLRKSSVLQAVSSSKAARQSGLEPTLLSRVSFEPGKEASGSTWKAGLFVTQSADDYLLTVTGGPDGN